MPDAWIFHPLSGALAFGRDDLKHRTIFRLHEVVAVVFVINPELEVLDVPIGELFGIGRGNRRVLKTSKHALFVIVAGLTGE